MNVIVYNTNGFSRTDLGRGGYMPDRVIYKWLKKKFQRVRHVNELGCFNEKKMISEGRLLRIISAHNYSLNDAFKYALSIDRHSDMACTPKMNCCLTHANWLAYGVYSGVFDKAGVIGPDHSMYGYEVYGATTLDELVKGKVAYLPSKKIRVQVKEELIEKYNIKGWSNGRGGKLTFNETYRKMKPVEFAKKFIEKVKPEETLLTICSDSKDVIKKKELLEIVSDCSKEGVKCIDYAVENIVNKKMLQLLEDIINAAQEISYYFNGISSLIAHQAINEAQAVQRVIIS